MARVTVEYGNGHAATRPRPLFSDLFATSADASAEERKMLVEPPNDSVRVNLAQAQQMSTIACLIFTTIAVVIFTVLVGLSYQQVAQTVSQVDRSVSLRKTAVNLLTNLDSLLNNTARFASDAHTTAEAVGPKVSDVLGNLHAITANPTISIG